MTSKQITKVADKYIRELGREGYVPIHGLSAKPDHEQVFTSSQLNHVAWMCEQVKIFVEEGNSDKANRWLGFVQGVMWCTGFYSVDEMREHNRSMV